MDDRVLALATGEDPRAVAPVRFGPPVSPHLAAELSGTTLTAAGLVRLQLPQPALAGLPPEFAEGMVAPARSRVLGDVGESAPEAWAAPSRSP